MQHWHDQMRLSASPWPCTLCCPMCSQCMTAVTGVHSLQQRPTWRSDSIFDVTHIGPAGAATKCDPGEDDGLLLLVLLHPGEALQLTFNLP